MKRDGDVKVRWDSHCKTLGYLQGPDAFDHSRHHVPKAETVQRAAALGDRPLSPGLLDGGRDSCLGGDPSFAVHEREAVQCLAGGLHDDDLSPQGVAGLRSSQFTDEGLVEVGGQRDECDVGCVANGYDGKVPIVVKYLSFVLCSDLQL